MEYNIWWFLAGAISLTAGFVLTRFYKEVSDNLLSGASSYDRCKKVGVGACIIGFILIFNLHGMVLGLIGNLITGGRN